MKLEVEIPDDMAKKYVRISVDTSDYNDFKDVKDGRYKTTKYVAIYKSTENKN